MTSAAGAQDRGGTPGAQVDADQLPIDIGRIQQQLDKPATINLDAARPLFRVEVVQKRPNWLGNLTWLPEGPKLPTPTTPAWHQEFLNMVTPPQARLYGQSRNGELLQLAATSLVQALISNAIVTKARSAAADRRATQAREEVDQAIADWEKAHGRQATGNGQ